MKIPLGGKKRKVEIMKNLLKTKVMGAAGGIMMAAAPMVAHASGLSGYAGTDANKIMNGVKSLLTYVGTWGGGLYAAVAIFTLVLALRNEDNEGRNKAILNLLAAIALLSMGVILGLFFN